MLELKYLPGGNEHHHGTIPLFLDHRDERDAKQQLDAHYQHGGGWRSFDGFTLRDDDWIVYPMDPPHPPRVEIKLRDERILIYDHAWVCVVQPDRSYEICRMD